MLNFRRNYSLVHSGLVAAVVPSTSQLPSQSHAGPTSLSYSVCHYLRGHPNAQKRKHNEKENRTLSPLNKSSFSGHLYGIWGHTLLRRRIATTPVNHLFWERDAKGGYGSKEKHSRKKLIQEGLKELRLEMSKWNDEMREKVESDPIFVRPGDMDKVWTLKSEEALKNWVTTSDQHHKEGFSSCSLTLSPTGHGLFSGQINTQVPKDGRVKKAGYCNMKSIRPRKSFKREVYLNWSLYNTLELRIRGDGRSYMLNISTAGYFDLHWNDIYSYPLYTRGGPHWQVTRIPFSKFFLNSKGRLQDLQCPIPLAKVISVGISAGDRVSAPFRLEVDYIGVWSDPDHTEEFAYEMYKLPKYYVGQ